MLVCPDCRNITQELSCPNCLWHSGSDINEKIIRLIGKKDLDDPIFKSYLQNYDQICSDDLNKTMLPEQYLRNQAVNVVKYIPDAKNKKICDIGSGQGFLIQALLKKGVTDLTAVDICDQYLNNLPPSVRCIKANAENLPFEEEFDIVIATDILEHVFNVGSFLYCVNKSLKPGGLVYIRVPYKEDLTPYSPHLGCPYRFVHLRTFNEELLKQSLNDSGFKILNLYYDGFWINLPNKAWSQNIFLNNIYQKLIVSFFEKFLHNKEDITLWNSWFCRLFMRPCELLIIGVNA